EVAPGSAAATLQPAETLTFSVTFSPALRGAAQATLTFHTDAGDEAVSLSGTGRLATADLSASELRFGTQRAGTTSSAQTITLAPVSFGGRRVGTTSAASAVLVTNTGSDAMVVSAPALSGDFAATPAAGATLAPGASASWLVSFAPTATDARSGSISFVTDAG